MEAGALLFGIGEIELGAGLDVIDMPNRAVIVPGHPGPEASLEVGAKKLCRASEELEGAAGATCALLQDGIVEASPKSAQQTVDGTSLCSTGFSPRSLVLPVLVWVCLLPRLLERAPARQRDSTRLLSALLKVRVTRRRDNRPNRTAPSQGTWLFSLDLGQANRPSKKARLKISGLRRSRRGPATFWITELPGPRVLTAPSQHLLALRAGELNNKIQHGRMVPPRRKPPLHVEDRNLI